MKFIIGLESETRTIEVEPFLFDVLAERFHCPWCHESFEVDVLHATMYWLLRRMSLHIGERHPDKHKDTPLAFLLAEPNP